MPRYFKHFFTLFLLILYYSHFTYKDVKFVSTLGETALRFKLRLD